MATGGEPSVPTSGKTVTSLTDCRRCTSLCLGPAILPCGHVICRKCLHDVVQEQGPKAACQQCGQCLDLPNDQGLIVSRLAQQMGTDPVMERLVYLELGKGTDVRCLHCPNKQALNVCLDCQEYYCDFCSACHQRGSVAKNHVLLLLPQSLQNSQSVASASERPSSPSPPSSPDSTSNLSDSQLWETSDDEAEDMDEWTGLVRKETDLLKQASREQQELETTLQDVLTLEHQLLGIVLSHQQLLDAYQHHLPSVNVSATATDPGDYVSSVGNSEASLAVKTESLGKRLSDVRKCSRCPSLDALITVKTRVDQLLPPDEATFRYTVENIAELKKRTVNPACTIRNLPCQPPQNSTMATEGEPSVLTSRKTVTSLTDCRRCVSLCLGPVIQPCGHVICRKCLHDMLVQQGHGAACQQCDHSLGLPSTQGLIVSRIAQQMGTDPVIEQLVYLELGKGTDLRCLHCPNKQALNVCLDCQEYYCDFCSACHQRGSAVKNHVLLLLPQCLQNSQSVASASERPSSPSPSPPSSQDSISNLPDPQPRDTSGGEAEGMKKWKEWVGQEMDLLQKAYREQQELETTLQNALTQEHQLLGIVLSHQQLLDAYQHHLPSVSVNATATDPGSYVSSVGNSETNMAVKTESLGKRLGDVRKCSRCPSLDALITIKTRVDQLLPPDEATFRYTVEHITELKEEIESPVCMIRNLPWKISARPETSKNTDNQKSLAVYVECNAESDSKSWSCQATVEYRLLNTLPDTKPFTKKLSLLFSAKNSAWGPRDFMPWDVLIDPEKGYVKDDKITLEVCVKVDAPRDV